MGSHSPASGVGQDLLRAGRRRRSPTPPPAARRGHRWRPAASTGPRSAANASTASIRSHSAPSSRLVSWARRVPSGAAWPRRYLPVSRPNSSGKNGRMPTPNVLAGGDQLVLDVAVEQGVLVLGADEPLVAARLGRPVRVDDLPPGEVGAADVAHLALEHQLVQRRERLLDRGDRVGARAAGTGRCSRCAAGAGSTRRPGGCSGGTRARPSRGRWRRACPCRTSSPG